MLSYTFFPVDEDDANVSSDPVAALAVADAKATLAGKSLRQISPTATPIIVK